MYSKHSHLNACCLEGLFVSRILHPFARSGSGSGSGMLSKGSDVGFLL